MKRRKGSLIIISAPSGAGKTTLSKLLLAQTENLKPSVSYTSRKPREGEIDGVDYSFVTEKLFREMISKGEFVEWAEVHGNLYGTSKTRINELLENGYDVFLDIDVQGARQIRQVYVNGLYIFILPPSMDVLKSRLEGRGSNTPEDMELRLSRSVDEIRDYNRYDYVIVNDTVDRALYELKAVITAQRLRVGNIDAAWIRQTFLETK